MGKWDWWSHNIIRIVNIFYRLKHLIRALSVYDCDLVFWALRILRPLPPDLLPPCFLLPEPEEVTGTPEGGEGSRGTAKFSLLFSEPSTEAAR